MLNYLSGPTRQRGNHEARPGFPTPRVWHSATQSFGLVQDNDTCNPSYRILLDPPLEHPPQVSASGPHLSLGGDHRGPGPIQQRAVGEVRSPYKPTRTHFSNLRTAPSLRSSPRLAITARAPSSW